LNSYSEAFTLTREGQPLLTPLEINGNEVRLRVNTLWTDPVRGLATTIFVPTAIPLRFSWDQGVHGYLVQMPGGAPHFCHPRLRHPGYEAIAELADQELLSEIDSPTLDVTGEPMYPFSRCRFWWESWFDRVRAALQKAVLDLSQSKRKVSENLVRTYLQRAITQLVSGAPGQKDTALPLTDERLIVRQRFEVRRPALGEADQLAVEDLALLENDLPRRGQAEVVIPVVVLPLELLADRVPRPVQVNPLLGVGGALEQTGEETSDRGAPDLDPVENVAVTEAGTVELLAQIDDRALRDHASAESRDRV
jgi:hypothetical protein